MLFVVSFGWLDGMAMAQIHVPDVPCDPPAARCPEKARPVAASCRNRGGGWYSRESMNE